jgi:hypothetical protein
VVAHPILVKGPGSEIVPLDVIDSRHHSTHPTLAVFKIPGKKVKGLDLSSRNYIEANFRHERSLADDIASRDNVVLPFIHLKRLDIHSSVRF